MTDQKVSASFERWRVWVWDDQQVRSRPRLLRFRQGKPHWKHPEEDGSAGFRRRRPQELPEAGGNQTTRSNHPFQKPRQVAEAEVRLTGPTKSGHEKNCCKPSGTELSGRRSRKRSRQQLRPHTTEQPLPHSKQ